MKIGTLEEAFCVEKPYEQQISKEGIQKAFSKLFGVKHRVQQKNHEEGDFRVKSRFYWEVPQVLSGSQMQGNIQMQMRLCNPFMYLDIKYIHTHNRVLDMYARYIQNLVDMTILVNLFRRDITQTSVYEEQPNSNAQEIKRISIGCRSNKNVTND